MSFWSRVSGGPRKQASWLRPCRSIWGSHLLVLWFDSGGFCLFVFTFWQGVLQQACGKEDNSLKFKMLFKICILAMMMAHKSNLHLKSPPSFCICPSVCLSIRPYVCLSVHSFIMHASSDLKSGWIPAGGKDSFEQIKRTMSQTFGSLSSFGLPNVGKTNLARREEHRTWPTPWEASFSWFLSYCPFSSLILPVPVKRATTSGGQVGLQPSFLEGRVWVHALFPEGNRTGIVEATHCGLWSLQLWGNSHIATLRLQIQFLQSLHWGLNGD